MNQPIQHINPEGLFKSPAFSQIVTTQGNGKTIYIVQGEDLHRGFQASQKYLGGLKNPPAITGFFVVALTNPDFLVEIDAVAFLPEE